ncbi:MAG: Veg family protein [Clostridia bacterium]|nr:Veg family protein [Clostridia bacterium]MBQ4587464.1 Veg family protein [Clostridia bacterium]MBQ6883100.1 Veg family protein [Clostridia bacterium]MBR6687786.1 Veg family protein [Clostridia bacterium]
MIKQNKCVSVIKKDIEALFEKPVKITQNLGRNKYVSFFGVITGVYPALFTVLPKDKYLGKTSFSYSEVLMGSVKVNKVV